MGKGGKRRINERMKCRDERVNSNDGMKTRFTSFMETSAESYSHWPPSRIVSGRHDCKPVPSWSTNSQEMSLSFCTRSYFRARWCLPHWFSLLMYAGLSPVVLFPLFQFVLFLAHFHQSGRETTGSLSRWSLQGAKKT